jgi:hypothetical protein
MEKSGAFEKAPISFAMFVFVSVYPTSIINSEPAERIFVEFNIGGTFTKSVENIQMSLKIDIRDFTLISKHVYTNPDFRLPPRWWWHLRSSGILGGVVFTDVSGQRIGPIFKGQARILNPWRWDRYAVPKRR